MSNGHASTEGKVMTNDDEEMEGGITRLDVGPNRTCRQTPKESAIGISLAIMRS